MKPGTYWERRYANGGNSGKGSRGKTARAKGRFINSVINTNRVKSVIDWGCGDGKVLSYVKPGVDLVGVDVSKTVIDRVSAKFPDWRFFVDDAPGVKCDLAMSLDVLFHLPDDEDFYAYLDRLFGSARKLVLIYSTDHDTPLMGHHLRRRRFTPVVSERHPRWKLVKVRKSGDYGYYLYRRRRVK